MTILDWLVVNMQKLHDADVDSPRRDCLVLIEDLLDKDRSWVITHAEFKLSKSQTQKLNTQIKHRVSREPLAYIRGKAWFYGRFFEVNSDVMVPRPESESFIELLKEIKPKNIVDIGTGSGCLAITAKLELPDCKVVATDTEGKALKVARQNARNHQVNIKFLQGSLLDPLLSTNYKLQTTIIANLPYVPTGLVTSEEINYEPKAALFSGKDGLDHYRQFWPQITELPKRPKYILTESLENQHQIMAKLAKTAGYKLKKTDVLVQFFSLLS